MCLLKLEKHQLYLVYHILSFMLHQAVPMSPIRKAETQERLTHCSGTVMARCGSETAGLKSKGYACPMTLSCVAGQEAARAPFGKGREKGEAQARNPTEPSSKPSSGTQQDYVIHSLIHSAISSQEHLPCSRNCLCSRNSAGIRSCESESAIPRFHTLPLPAQGLVGPFFASPS